MRKKNGFTVVELLIVIALIGIISGIGIPNFLTWLPKYRLKGAARDLYSNLQLARVGAIKANKTWAIVFDEGGNKYTIYSDYGGANSVQNTIELSDYKSDITYGSGSASTESDGGALGDLITYSNDRVEFSSKGTANVGNVYLTNVRNDNCFEVGTLLSGVVLLQEWNGSSWQK